MTPLDLGVMFSLGLVSSLHCVQMCGPIVLSYSVALESLTRPAGRQFIPSLLTNHLAYNAGRIITYTALGALAGLAGHSMGLLGRLAGFSHAAAIITGSLMIVAGIFLLGIIPSRFRDLSPHPRCVPARNREKNIRPWLHQPVCSRIDAWLLALRSDLCRTAESHGDGFFSIGCCDHAGLRPGHGRRARSDWNLFVRDSH